MIDVVIPANPRNAEYVALSITKLAEITTIPLRFVVAARGGVRSDWNVIRETLSSMRDVSGLHYGLMLRDRVVTSSAKAVDGAINTKTGHVKHEYILILRPEVSITDKEWFGKMVSPLQRAPYVGGVFLPDEFVTSATVPHSLNEASRRYTTRGVLTTRAHIQMVGDIVITPECGFYDDFLQSAIVRAGAVRWMHCGVRFKVDNGATWTEEG